MVFSYTATWFLVCPSISVYYGLFTFYLADPLPLLYGGFSIPRCVRC